MKSWSETFHEQNFQIALTAPYVIGKCRSIHTIWDALCGGKKIKKIYIPVHHGNLGVTRTTTAFNTPALLVL
jgi:hypothetical protein